MSSRHLLCNHDLITFPQAPNLYFVTLLPTFFVDVAEDISRVEDDRLGHRLGREAGVDNEVAGAAAAALRKVPERLGVRLNQDPGPVALPFEKQGVAEVDPVPGSGLDVEAVEFLVEVVVDDVGLVELAVPAII